MVILIALVKVFHMKLIQQVKAQLMLHPPLQQKQQKKIGNQKEKPKKRGEMEIRERGGDAILKLVMLVLLISGKPDS